MQITMELRFQLRLMFRDAGLVGGLENMFKEPIYVILNGVFAVLWLFTAGCHPHHHNHHARPLRLGPTTGNAIFRVRFGAPHYRNYLSILAKGSLHLVLQRVLSKLL